MVLDACHLPPLILNCIVQRRKAGFVIGHAKRERVLCSKLQHPHQQLHVSELCSKVQQGCPLCCAGCNGRTTLAISETDMVAHALVAGSL